jgi:hypothetical protein
MPFNFSPTLRQALAAILKGQPKRISDLQEDALSVIGDMSLVTYLTPDGRVLIEDEDTPLHETSNLYYIHSTLIRASERFGLPELRSFVPPAPAESILCPACQGTGYIYKVRIFCPDCQACGWIIPPA